MRRILFLYTYALFVFTRAQELYLPLVASSIQDQPFVNNVIERQKSSLDPVESVLKNVLQNSPFLSSHFIQLVLRDCLTYSPYLRAYGCNGSLLRNNQELSQPHNSFLERAVSLLNSIRGAHDASNAVVGGPGLTAGDLIALAGMQAIRFTGGPAVNITRGRRDTSAFDSDRELCDVSRPDRTWVDYRVCMAEKWFSDSGETLVLGVLDAVSRYVTDRPCYDMTCPSLCLTHSPPSENKYTIYSPFLPHAASLDATAGHLTLSFELFLKEIVRRPLNGTEDSRLVQQIRADRDTSEQALKFLTDQASMYKVLASALLRLQSTLGARFPSQPVFLS